MSHLLWLGLNLVLNLFKFIYDFLELILWLFEIFWLIESLLLLLPFDSFESSHSQNLRNLEVAHNRNVKHTDQSKAADVEKAKVNLGIDRSHKVGVKVDLQQHHMHAYISYPPQHHYQLSCIGLVGKHKHRVKQTY